MMRLYPKKLRSIEDLEREKKTLLKKVKQLEKEEFLSVEGLVNNKKSKEKERDEKPSFVDLLPIPNPLVKQLLKLLERRFLTRRKSKKKEYQETDTVPHKSKIKAVALEFIGGYLKWKALELTFKGIRHIIKTRRQKKATTEQ